MIEALVPGPVFGFWEPTFCVCFEVHQSFLASSLPFPLGGWKIDVCHCCLLVNFESVRHHADPLWMSVIGVYMIGGCEC